MQPGKATLFPQTFIKFRPINFARLNPSTEGHSPVLTFLIILEVPGSVLDQQTGFPTGLAICLLNPGKCPDDG
jgi:hypothetical protein